MRLERFMHHDRLISEHNATNGANFTLGNNQFSDWTDAEYLAILKYNGPGSGNEKGSVKVYDNIDAKDNSEPPESVDWVKAGFNAPVKD